MQHYLGHCAIVCGALGLFAVSTPAAAVCGQAAFTPSSANGDAPASVEPANFSSHSIVGMWSFKFVSHGSLVDFGYVQWHSDGTEIMNSGGRAPATENFCLGVWERTSPFTYKLNHIALSYDQSSGKLNGKVRIQEDVVLDPRGENYSGPFTLDVYDPNTGAALQHVSGRVIAKRVTVNSTP